MFNAGIGFAAGFGAVQNGLDSCADFGKNTGLGECTCNNASVGLLVGRPAINSDCFSALAR